MDFGGVYQDCGTKVYHLEMDETASQGLYQTIYKKAESKERLRGMRNMARRGLGFNFIENFCKNSSEMERHDQKQGREEEEDGRGCKEGKEEEGS